MKNFLIIFIGLILIVGCSEDKNPLPSVTHPEGWNVKGSDNFHGTKVLEIGYNSCKSCHGIDLKGGKAGYSCFECHQTYPHPDEWMEVEDENFHGNFVENANSTTYCQSCHGSDLKGGKSGVSCYDCHPEGDLP